MRWTLLRFSTQIGDEKRNYVQYKFQLSSPYIFQVFRWSVVSRPVRMEIIQSPTDYGHRNGNSKYLSISNVCLLLFFFFFLFILCRKAKCSYCLTMIGLGTNFTQRPFLVEDHSLKILSGADSIVLCCGEAFFENIIRSRLNGADFGFEIVHGLNKVFNRFVPVTRT